MHSITLYYTSKSFLDIETPTGFKWIGRGIDLKDSIRDWQIEGNLLDNPTFMSKFIEFLEEQVKNNEINPKYEIVISRIDTH